MKIAILTYWSSSNNYGQQLQMYALQTYLRNEGHDAYLVRYIPRKEKKPHWRRVLSKLNPLKFFTYYTSANIEKRKVGKEKKELVKQNELLDVKRDFEGFRSKNVKMSDRVYYTIEELRANPPKADIYITGSDQVWHDPLSNPNIEGWYLNFGSNGVKRYSYAASIGREISVKEKNSFARLLSRFNDISVREKSGMAQVANAGFSCCLVVDPTLLLNKVDYTRLLPPVSISIKPYVFVYILNVTYPEDILVEKITEYTEKNNFDIKAVSSSGYTPAKEMFVGTRNIQATIPEWLSLINNSQLVVTTSFHGVVFSILFEKPFIAVPLKGKNSSANDRIYNLLDQLGLSDRIYTAGVPLTQQAERPIDWLDVQSRIDSMKSSSLTYLQKITKT